MHRVREAKFVAAFLTILGIYGVLTWSRFIKDFDAPSLSLPSLLYFSGAAAYLIGGIWLFLHREWARKLILALAGVLVALCAVPALHFGVILAQYLLSRQEYGMHAAVASYSMLGIASLGLLIWHLWLLVYFSQPNVKAHFQSGI